MRGLIAFVGICALVLHACANPYPPRGAPVDDLPPQLRSTTPDSGAVSVDAREVEFIFDEVVSERPSGITDLSRLFLISPDVGDPRVAWRRRALAVRPRGGFLPNTTYTITILPGVVDLQQNVTRESRSIVFSTGDSLHTAKLTGIVFDWLVERPAPRALVQAIPLQQLNTRPPPQDTVLYSAVTDSAGRFVIANLPNGEYSVRAFADNNADRSLDSAYEKFDTARVVVSDSVRREFLIYVHDAQPPSFESITVRDTFTVIARFHRPVDPAQVIDTSTFRILDAADSSSIPLALARAARPFELLGAVGAVRTDSAIRADSIRDAQRDTSLVRQAVMPSRPAPPTSFLIQLSRPLTPGRQYILRSLAVRGLAGNSIASLDRTFTVPRRDTLAYVPPSQRNRR